METVDEGLGKFADLNGKRLALVGYIGKQLLIQDPDFIYRVVPKNIADSRSAKNCSVNN